MRTLFKNADILARHDDGTYEIIEKGFLGVEDGIINYLGTIEPDVKADIEKDMSGKLLMPGLVNAHGHAPMTLVRGEGTGLKLQDWLNNAIFPIEARMVPDDIKAGETVACIEMIAGGTTLFSNSYDFPWADAESIMKSGLKANLGRVGLCFDPNVEMRDWDRFRQCVDFVTMFNDPNRRVMPEFNIHSEYLSTEKFVTEIAKANSKIHAVVDIHVSETELEHEECKKRHRGLTPIAYFLECGILEEPTYCAHCVWVTEGDLEIMAEKGVSIAHNPTSNMKLGSGFAPIAKATEMGINCCLGTDGVASNDNLNMFEELHIASLIHKGIAKDPTVLSTDKLLDMATINGAKAMGRTDTGVLAVGKAADIIAIDMDKPHLYPQHDKKALLCFSAQASDVCMTMVDGQILYENGVFFTIDVEKAHKDFDAAIKRLYL